MRDLFFLILGSVLGWFLHTIMDHFFSASFRSRMLRIAGALSNRRSRASIGRGGDTERAFLFGTTYFKTEWVSIDGTGSLPYGRDHLVAELADEPLELPADLASLHKQAMADLESRRKAGRSDIWQGRRFALRRYLLTRLPPDEVPGIVFTFAHTDYAAYVGLTVLLDSPGLVREASTGKPTTIRLKYFSDFDVEEPNPFVTHSFGVNLVVLTSDNRIVFTQRNSSVTRAKGAFHISVNEGMQYPADLMDGRPSFLTTAIRGLREELGVEVDPATVEFLNFGALTSSNEYALLGLVQVQHDEQELLACFHRQARDRGQESRHRLWFVRCLPDDLRGFIETHRPWSHQAIPAVYFALVRLWGARLAESQFLSKLRSVELINPTRSHEKPSKT